MSEEENPKRRKEDFDNQSKKLSIWGDRIVLIGASVFAFIFFSSGLYHLLINKTPWLVAMVQDHFNALVVTPMTMISSTAIVLLLRYTEGNIEMKLPFGIEFKGAAAPIVFWVMIFLAIESTILAKW